MRGRLGGEADRRGGGDGDGVGGCGDGAVGCGRGGGGVCAADERRGWERARREGGWGSPGGVPRRGHEGRDGGSVGDVGAGVGLDGGWGLGRAGVDGGLDLGRRFRND